MFSPLERLAEKIVFDMTCNCTVMLIMLSSTVDNVMPIKFMLQFLDQWL